MSEYYDAEILGVRPKPTTPIRNRLEEKIIPRMTYGQLVTLIIKDTNGFYPASIRDNGFTWTLQGETTEEKIRNKAQTMREYGCNTLIVPMDGIFLLYMDSSPSTQYPLIEGKEIHD